MMTAIYVQPSGGVDGTSVNGTWTPFVGNVRYSVLYSADGALYDFAVGDAPYAFSAAPGAGGALVYFPLNVQYDASNIDVNIAYQWLHDNIWQAGGFQSTYPSYCDDFVPVLEESAPPYPLGSAAAISLFTVPIPPTRIEYDVYYRPSGLGGAPGVINFGLDDVSGLTYDPAADQISYNGNSAAGGLTSGGWTHVVIDFIAMTATVGSAVVPITTSSPLTWASQVSRQTDFYEWWASNASLTYADEAFVMPLVGIPDPCAVPPPAPNNFPFSSVGTLGCEETSVFLTSRCGQVVCDLTDVMESGEWKRILDDTSETKYTFAAGGDSSCCGCLGGARTWIHGLLVIRGGKPAWWGPVVNISIKRDTVAITARDVTAWFDKRIIHNDYEFVDATLREVVQTLVEDALSIDDPCNLLSQIVYQDDLDDIRITKTIVSGDGKAGDVLRDLAANYLDMTALGARIVFGRQLSYGPFVTLSEEDFLVDIEIEERGLEAATKWYVSANQGAVLGSSGGVDPYYGLLEELAAEDSIQTVAEANSSADARVQATNPAPVYVNIPDGARLSPNAPLPIERLVPGTLMNIHFSSVCRPMLYQGRLTAVKVGSSPGDEAVGITIAPLGTNFNQAKNTVSRTAVQ